MNNSGKVLAVAALLSLYTLGADAQEQPVDNNPARIRSAKQLLAQQEHFKLRVRHFQQQAEQSVRIAEKLRGEAEKFQSNLEAQQAKLDKSKLSAAVKQFDLDLAEFKKHSESYAKHTQQVRAQFGVCKESESEFAINAKDYELHAEQFHLPNVRPPMICPRLGTSVGESQSLANQMRADQDRVLKAEQELQQTEARLQNAIAQGYKASSGAMRESRREHAEQELAKEFARLKEEYDLLCAEHNAIAKARGSKSLSIPSVSVKGTLKDSGK